MNTVTDQCPPETAIQVESNTLPSMMIDESSIMMEDVARMNSQALLVSDRLEVFGRRLRGMTEALTRLQSTTEMEFWIYVLFFCALMIDMIWLTAVTLLQSNNDVLFQGAAELLPRLDGMEERLSIFRTTLCPES